MIFKMNTASLDLCRELHKLSDWKGTEHAYYADPGGLPSIDATGLSRMVAPAYDLGYLLRKLPRGTSIKHTHLDEEIWFAEYEHDKARFLITGASGLSPEDAVAKLAVELFEQGILTPADAA